MSVTVYVDGWHEQPHRDEKVYVCDRYPFLTPEECDFHRYQKDADGRHYEIDRIYENPFPEMNMANGNWKGLAVALGIDNEENVGALAAQDIPTLIRKCILLSNSTARCMKAARPGHQTKNIIDFGTTPAYVREKAVLLLSILTFAQSKNKGIYWA